MRVYLDVSCLNRPFDDQTQPRIRLEAEAVVLILERFEAGDWEHVSSEMAGIEIAANPDEDRRRRVKALLPDDSAIVKLDVPILNRAAELESLGLKPADAVHVAAAESIPAAAFLTCDDRLLRTAQRHQDQITMIVANPLEWLNERDDDADA